MKKVLFIMPFGKGTYTNNSGEAITTNFDEFFDRFVKKYSGQTYEVHRVDRNSRTDIYNKMFKMINAVDIVIADLTGLNSNVMYELGVRHTLRNKKTIMIMKDVESVPFNVSTFAVHKSYDVYEDFERFIEGDEDDSPVKRFVSPNHKDDLKIFDGFTSDWENFRKEYKDVEYDYDNQSTIFEKYNKFNGIESFDQKKSLYTYKKSNGSLQDAKVIIEAHNPSTSNNYETIGLACSISWRMLERAHLARNFRISRDLSRYFIAKYKDAYSFSSYSNYLISAFTANFITYEYLKEESRNLFNEFNEIGKESNDEEYIGYTYALLGASCGEESDLFEDDSNKQNAYITSKHSYLKALDIYKNNNKEDEND